jgi:hypothetical protein
VPEGGLELKIHHSGMPPAAKLLLSLRPEKIRLLRVDPGFVNLPLSH